ncbi:MAG TPA: hypothetical protein DDZ51_19630 [Planctomycetaceae bacterium]|nr:hypothetical protein [Planctomycetaceae bacterium]
MLAPHTVLIPLKTFVLTLSYLQDRSPLPLPSDSDRDPVPPSHDADSDRPARQPAVGSAAWMVAQTETIRRIAAGPIIPSVATSLRRMHGAEAAALILTIAGVQSRSVEKFGPGVWMATEKSIAQATDRVVASYKASLFENESVFDLCSGIGGDAMELAKRGPVVAIDVDRQIAEMAAANLTLDAANRSGSSPTPVAVCDDVMRFKIPADAAIHIDPDRRPSGKSRVVRPSSYLPSIDEVARLISGGRPAIVKLAPAAELDEDTQCGPTSLIVAENHRQWISFDGSVREQALLSGSCISAAGVNPGGRSAVRVWAGGRRECFAVDEADASHLADLDRAIESVWEVPPYLIDVDPAVRAAGLSSSIATARGCSSLGGPAGFFGCEKIPTDRSLMHFFETIWSGPADLKRIKSWVRQQGLWVESVKVRSTGQDPAEWTKSLRGNVERTDANVVVCFISRWSNGTNYAAITQRIRL